MIKNESSRKYREKNLEACRERCRNYRRKNSELCNERAERWRKANPEKSMLTCVKKTARNKGLDFNLEHGDIIIPEFCPVLGVKLEPNQGGHKRANNMPTVDRIDSTKGYVKGNIQVVSWRANWLKSNGSLKEFRKIVAYMESHQCVTGS